MKKETSPQNVSSHITRNIILTLVCLPPVWASSLLMTSLFVLEPFKSPVGWAPLILFLTLGIVIAAVCARRIRSKHASEDLQGAIKISKRCKRGYTIATILIWLLGIFLAVALPGFLAYRQRALYVASKSVIHSLIIAQETYRARNRTFTIKLDELKGWTGDPRVEVVIHRADSGCWSATVKAKGISRFFQYDHCGGGLKEMSSDLR